MKLKEIKRSIISAKNGGKHSIIIESVNRNDKNSLEKAGYEINMVEAISEYESSYVIISWYNV